MGTCWDRVCGSLLFLPLYPAVRAQGPILSDILLMFTQPAGQPRFRSLFGVPAARGLLHQGEGTGRRGGERWSLGGRLFPRGASGRKRGWGCSWKEEIERRRRRAG